MAKRKTKSTSNANRDIVKICAFWGLAISAILYVVSGLIDFLVKVIESLRDTKTAAVLGRISGIASIIASVSLAVAIAIPAYGYVKGKGRNWKVFYWIVLAVYILGIVFGLLPSFL